MGYGGILKIELSRESELNPEGWRASEIGQNSICFSRPAPEPPQRWPRTVFWAVVGPKVSQSGAQWVPKSIKNHLKVVSGIHLISPWLPDPPQDGPWPPKRYQNGSKIDDFCKFLEV